MQSFQRKKMDDLVFDSLLENIRNHVWKSGEKLPSENELCQVFQVSRATIRSSIQRLRALGLVEVRQGKGSFVLAPTELYDFTHFSPNVNLTPKQFADFSALREAVEEKAIALIVENRQRIDFTPIESAYLAMKEAASNNDPEEYARQDCMFHLSILIASGNELFIQIANIFKNQYYDYFREMNKFLFDENGDMRALFDPNDPSDAHAVLYHRIRHDNDEKSRDAFQVIMSNNRHRFRAYLDSKDLGK